MNWECDCGTVNEDVPEDTAVPICGGCDREWFWLEIDDAQRQARLIA